MRRLLLFTLLTITSTFVFGQKSIDALFDKYAGKDGFTTVTINGNLLKFARCLDKDAGHDNSSFPAGVTEIRILSQEDTTMNVENFYKMAIKDIDLNLYEEFMRVKNSEQDLRMLVRTEGNKFKEFLMIAGGEDNAIIQIKGNLTIDDAKKISEDARKNHHFDIVANQNQ
jgi:hypothetical protein